MGAAPSRGSAVCRRRLWAYGLWRAFDHRWALVCAERLVAAGTCCERTCERSDMCVCTVSCEDEMWIFLGARQPGVPRAFGLVVVRRRAALFPRRSFSRMYEMKLKGLNALM